MHLGFTLNNTPNGSNCSYSCSTQFFRVHLVTTQKKLTACPIHTLSTVILTNIFCRLTGRQTGCNASRCCNLMKLSRLLQLLLLYRIIFIFLFIGLLDTTAVIVVLSLRVYRILVAIVDHCKSYKS